MNVSAAGTVINHSTLLTADIAPGVSEIFVADPSAFASGDLVLIWHDGGLADVTSGDQTAIALQGSHIGAYELARVQGVTASTLELAAPMLGEFPSTNSQVVFVPEYASVTVQPGAALVAEPWSPVDRHGGVLALFVRGTLLNSGQLTAAGRGMAGGELVIDPNSDTGCSDLDEPAANGAARGEGLDTLGTGSTGRGNLANAAGGGVCWGSGGGGGAHAGAGGKGGRTRLSDGGRDVGGLGGASLNVGTASERLLFGGGGGAGHARSGGSSGGAGGGVVFLRAGTLSGAGSIDASGADAV
ncbi:MAG TPA: hypothetical protein VJR89_01940, partial [Polyangiales bacterium]|nr:hypothetical protein [Polyangiales bacterium]